MKPETQRKLLERAMLMLREKRPEMSASAVESPLSRYVDQTQYEAERALFLRFPQPVAPVSDVAKPGDWLAREYLGVPILIVRNAEGKLGAFLNVCRHRGMQLAPCGSGEGKQHFFCAYHAWRYGTDGELQFVPKDYAFPGLDKGKFGLRRLAVEERCGLIWVVPNPDYAHLNISEILGPLADEVDHFGCGKYEAYARRNFSLTTNWKIVTDGSAEDYHFKILHKHTSSVLFADNAQVVDDAGLNRRFFLFKNTLQMLTPAQFETCKIRLYGNILYFFFPGTWYLVQPDHVMVTHIVPHGVSNTGMEEVALIPKVPEESDLEARQYWDNNVELFRRTLDEDYVVSEKVQAGLLSGANETLLFGRLEYACERFHQQLEALLRLGPRAAGQQDVPMFSPESLVREPSRKVAKGA